MSVYVNKSAETVDEGIANMIAAANEDYMDFSVNDNMKAEFPTKWAVKKGSKYVKVMTDNGGSAWGFVVNTEKDAKFKKGDILMCAGWAAPTRNAARGNVLEGGYPINWTGPLYL